MSGKKQQHLEVGGSFNMPCLVDKGEQTSPQDVLEAARRIAKYTEGILEMEKEGIITDVYPNDDPLHIHYTVRNAKEYDQRRKKWDLPTRFCIVTTDEKGNPSFAPLEKVPSDWNYDDEWNCMLEWEPE